MRIEPYQHAPEPYTEGLPFDGVRQVQVALAVVPSFIDAHARLTLHLEMNRNDRTFASLH